METIKLSTALCEKAQSANDSLLEVERKKLEAWFADGSARDERDILQDAYEKARVFFALNTPASPEKTRVWFDDKHTMEDVIVVVDAARDRYQTKPTAKAFQWLTRFSEKLAHYGPILDVVCQHHPEYTALVWGAFKFLFGAIVSHEEQTKKLAKACAQVADVLPRIEITATLYKTAEMQRAVSELYARIILFLQHAFDWYCRGKMSHVWSAIVRPWELGFRDLVEEITTYSKRVDKLAGVASHAELRASHLETRQMREELRETRLQVQQLLQLAIQNQSIQNQVQLDLSTSKTMIARIELNQILSLPFFSHFPTSGDTIRHCRTMRHRRRRQLALNKPTIQQLEQWSKDDRCAFLFPNSQSALTTKDFMVDMVDVINAAGIPAIWALRFEDYWKRPRSVLDLIRMLMLHALQVNSNSLSSTDYPITVAALRDAEDERDWYNLFAQALRGIPLLYIILDAQLLAHMTQESVSMVTRLLENLRQSVSFTAVKIVVPAMVVDAPYVRNRWDQFTWKNIHLDSSVASAKRPLINQRRRKRRRRN